MEHKHYDIDVLIIGGGPAGTSTALSLLNYSDNTVMVVEESNLGKARVGEHVSSSIFDLTNYLQIEKEAFEVETFLPAYETTAYWGSDFPSSTHSIYTAEGASFQLDRVQFDFKLIETVVDRGGIFLPRTKCSDFEQKEDGTWTVTMKHTEQGLLHVRANYLVDATGRSAMVCRQLNVPLTKFDTLMGVGAFVECSENKIIQHEQILEATENGWWYVAHLPDNKLVVTFFSDADLIKDKRLNVQENWIKALGETKQIKQRLKVIKLLTSRPWVRSAATQLSDASLINNFIAVGDAAAAFDPLSSMGIGFAMTSACHAAKLIQYQLKGETVAQSILFQEDLCKNFDNYMRIRQQFYEKEKRWDTADFWKRRNRQKQNAAVK